MKINPERFLATLEEAGIRFFAGVPDSYLDGICDYLLQHVPQARHVVTANEGNAIAVAAGHYFATGETPFVYMQNSGLGNALNPLVSLADEHVYRVPMMLLVGWRGEPGTGDHPQHVTQGKITPDLLSLMQIPYAIAEGDDERLEKQVRQLAERAAHERRPVALIGRKGIFSKKQKENLVSHDVPLSREQAIEVILDALPDDALYSATTGRATREIYFLREDRGEGHGHDYLNVGAMGHASSVALGLALGASDRLVVTLDGDAASIMHMGAMAIHATVCPPRFLHIVLNNGAHESVGGQPSVGQKIDLTAIARGAGYYAPTGPVSTPDEIREALAALTAHEGPGFLDVRVHQGLDGPLPPLDISHERLIRELMDELASER